MEFSFDLRRVLRIDADGVAVLDYGTTPTIQMRQIVNTLGQMSSQAQGLDTVITTAERFFQSSDQILYVLVDDNKVVGILKTGHRRLFYHNEIGRVIELTPLCLLDFYVHESCQRTGKGLLLYEKMLQKENIEPAKIAIDRPSAKCLSFMRKHFNLSDYVPQNNNYVIFQEFFQNKRTPRRKQQPVRQREERKVQIAPKRTSNNYTPIPPWATSYSQYSR